MPVTDATASWVEQQFTTSIVPTLVEYIKIPNKSAMFDPKWRENGHVDRAVELLAGWAKQHLPEGAKMEVVRLGERTPVIFIDIPGFAGSGANAKAGDTVMLYGHLDKQPEMTGWREGLGPWTPALEDGKLYGRGGADDGYAVFCALAALRSLEADGRPRPRVAMLIECCEESGSFDLPAYLEALAPRIGKPDLVIGLDSGCGNYEQLWGTTSLRGIVNGVLTVEVLTEGVHSGDASGVVASSFRIARMLLDRIDDSATGILRHPAFHAPIPLSRASEAQAAAKVLGREIWHKFPFVEGMRPMAGDLDELVLARTWRPFLEVTGADGLPPPASAGNVLRPKTSLVLSLRLPPTVDAAHAAEALKVLLESDPPYGARVSFSYGHGASGWHAPETAPWLEDALGQASKAHFGTPMMWMGEGGTIPFMAMLGGKFPEAQFVITGVLGPHSNAHGPNEFLHLDYAKKLSAAVADVLAAQARSASR